MCKRIVKVGADLFPPYQYFTADGNVNGIDYEKVFSIFSKAGYKIDVVIDESWSVIQEMFDQGKLDAAFQVQPTPERLQKYLFSDKLRDAVTEVVTSNKDLKIESYPQIEELNLKLGVIAGYTNGPEIDALDESVKFPYSNAVDLLFAVSRGEVDLAVYDKGVKEYLMEENGITNIVSIESMTFTRPLHVIFNDPVLRDEFNAAMSE